MQWYIFLSCLILFSYLKSAVKSEECGKWSNNKSPSWNVGIYVENDANRLELVCLGTTIIPDVIVTAAHCVCENLSGKLRNSTFYVSTGKLEKKFIDAKDKDLKKVKREDIVVHKNFKGLLEVKSDIAIIKVDNVHPMPVCMDWDNSMQPLQGNELLKHPIWVDGRIKIHDVSFIDPEFCQYLSSKAFNVFIANDKICSKSEKELIKEGDVIDGAGLVLLNKNTNQWYIGGVASSHDLENKNITTYSNIKLYLNWLSSQSI